MRAASVVLILAGMVVVATSGSVRAVSTQLQPSGVAGPAVAPQHDLLSRYCITCHNQKTKTAGLTLDTLDLSNIGGHAEVWEKVVRKLRAGLMPPAGRPRPDNATLDNFASWLETDLDRAAAAAPNAGRTEAFHRLNRAEYQNAIRDLLELDIDVTGLLPADDVSSHGFDNIAANLTVSPSQMERYLSAARKISRAAIGNPLAGPIVQEFSVPDSLSQYEPIEGLPFGTRGGMLVRYNFPQDGEYLIESELMCRVSGGCDGGAGFVDEHQLEVTVDGTRVQLFTLKPFQEPRPPGERIWQVRVQVAAGVHSVGVAFLALPAIREVDSRMLRHLRPYHRNENIGSPEQTIYQPFLERVRIAGPFNAARAGDTPSRRRIFACRPANDASEAACAKKILTTLARRAYRQPVSDAELQPLIRFYDEGRIEAGFEGGIERGLRRLLVSPEFLIRVERDPSGIAANTNYRISDLELASRLSFFLWSSIPDDELLDVATRGKLKDPAVLEKQVRRMMADARSQQLLNNFAGQWLQLRNLDAVSPSPPLFPDFDEGLRQGFRRETELFFESILREDRSVLDLLTANYTFVNERVARHYGIPNVYGTRFRRVTLTDKGRRGLLGHGSILTVTSRPNRTSPVLRGKWILENVLGTPPPPPLPNVPPLQETKDGLKKVLSVRERLVQHRTNPVCASCHSMIDPPGFALENFDAVGMWRDVDEARTGIDASGVLPDGTKFDGITGFREALLSHPDRFVTTVTEKLLTYALGRGTEYYDLPAIRRIVREAAPSRYKLSSLILGITKSTPFQMRRSADGRQRPRVAAVRPGATPLASNPGHPRAGAATEKTRRSQS